MVPQGGKKTIKVKLSVGPENQQTVTTSHSENTANNNNNNNNNKNNNNNSILSPNQNMGGTNDALKNVTSPALNPTSTHVKPKHRKNVNVTIQENVNRTAAGMMSRRAKHKERSGKYHSVRIPNGGHISTCTGCRNLSPDNLPQDCNASPLRSRKKWRERNCSLQRPDLCELLKANMEKNNVVSPCCKLNHRHHVSSIDPKGGRCEHELELPSPYALPAAVNSKTNEVAPHPCKHGIHETKVDGGNNVRNLKRFEYTHHHHVQHSSHRVHHSAHHSHHHHHNNGHHRSRSHDANGQGNTKHGVEQCAFTEPQDKCCTPSRQHGQLPSVPNMNTHIESVELIGGPDKSSSNDGSNNKNLINVSGNNVNELTVTTPQQNLGSSPHQMKHKNREQEHARAMSQVISWLERENISGNSNGRMEKKYSSPRRIKNFRSVMPFTPPVVRKLEHHHVHEHIHHHYHHYSKETPIIV